VAVDEIDKTKIYKLKETRSTMVVKLILIDIDDTICNSSESYKVALETCFKILREKYPMVSRLNFVDAFYKARDQIHLELNETASMHDRFLYFQRMFENLGLNFDPVILDQITESFWRETYKNLKLYPKVIRTLKKLKEANMKIGIISNLVAHIQTKKLKKLKIAKYIDFIVTSEEAGVEKPHPSIFLLALNKAGCLLKETVMVGDSVADDIVGAKHLGISAILVSKVAQTNESYIVIKTFATLPKVLKLKTRKQQRKKIIGFDLMGTVFKEGRIIKNLLWPLICNEKNLMGYEDLKSIYESYSVGAINQSEFRKHIPVKVEETFLDSVILNHNILDILRWLKKKKFRIGILSNIPKEWGNYLMKKYHLDDYAEIIVFSGDYGVRKPDEELYRIFIKLANTKPQNCFLVDDNLLNLREARHLRMKTIWKKNNIKDLIFVPDYIISKMEELKKIFK